MTFDDDVVLVKIIENGVDDNKNPIFLKIEKEVMCKESSISKNDFYNAGNVGLKLSYILTINYFEYEEESKVIYKNKELDVIKTYRNGDLLELTVGERIGK